MFQAARLGHSRSMARIALMPPFGETLSISDAALITEYNLRAAEYLAAAASQGDPVGLYGVFVSQSRGGIPTSYGSLPIEADVALGIAAGEALRRFADPETVRSIDAWLLTAGNRISPAERARAEALRDRFDSVFLGQEQRDFAGGVFRPDIDDTCVPE